MVNMVLSTNVHNSLRSRYPGFVVNFHVTQHVWSCDIETHADWSSLTGPSRTTWTMSFPSEWPWIMVWIDVWSATVEPRYIVLLHVLNYFIWRRW